MPTLTTFARVTFASLALVAAVGAQAQAQAPQSPATGTAAPAAGSQATVDAAFKQADTDRDGKLSGAELSQIPALASKLAELDKNKDGVVSSDEFSAGVTTK